MFIVLFAGGRQVNGSVGSVEPKSGFAYHVVKPVAPAACFEPGFVA
jgi:hypothetical protein